MQGGAATPPDYTGQCSYCFDSPIDPVELARICAESREMLTLLGFNSTIIAPEGSTWRFEDTVDLVAAGGFQARRFERSDPDC